MTATQADAGPRRAAAARRSRPSRSSPRIGGRPDVGQRHADRRARRRTTASASPVAPVTARSPRSMIAAFSRAIAAIVGPEPVGVVEIDVRDRRDAAIPGVGGVEPTAEPHLDEGEVEAAPPRSSGTRPRSAARTRSVAPWRRGHALGERQDLGDEPRERRRRRSAGRRPRSARDSVTRCGLGVSPTRQPGRPQRAARRARARCPCRSCPPTSAPRTLELRIAELAEQRPRAARDRDGSRTGRARPAPRSASA